MAKEKTIDDVFEAIEQLAITTKKGFDGVDQRFKEVDERFNDIESDLATFKKETESTLFSMNSKLETIDNRLDAIDKTLGPLVQISGAMQTEIRSLNLRVSRLEHEAGLVENH